MKLLSKKMYEYIQYKIDIFNKQTEDYYKNDLFAGDVVASYFLSTPSQFYIENDWDEGENNDPFWNKEKNEHCIYVFLKEVVTELDIYLTEL